MEQILILRKTLEPFSLVSSSVKHSGSSHRDLKYENILFVNDNPHAEVKLIDFGLSQMFGKEGLTDGVGTM